MSLGLQSDISMQALWLGILPMITTSRGLHVCELAENVEARVVDTRPEAHRGVSSGHCGFCTPSRSHLIRLRVPFTGLIDQHMHRLGFARPSVEI